MGVNPFLQQWFSSRMGSFATEACFELDAAELEEIMKNKKIYLTFVGQTVIPFMLKTTSIMDKAVQDDIKSSR